MEMVEENSVFGMGFDWVGEGEVDGGWVRE